VHSQVTEAVSSYVFIDVTVKIIDITKKNVLAVYIYNLQIRL
jgi:hypothetical protein